MFNESILSLFIKTLSIKRIEFLQMRCIIIFSLFDLFSLMLLVQCIFSLMFLLRLCLFRKYHDLFENFVTFYIPLNDNLFKISITFLLQKMSK